MDEKQFSKIKLAMCIISVLASVKGNVASRCLLFGYDR